MSHLPVIRRIQIENIAQLESHQIIRVHQTTSHVIRFVGGGLFTCIHDEAGTMVEAGMECLSATISSDGVLTLHDTLAESPHEG